MKNIDPENLYHYTEIAALLHVRPSTVLRWMSRRQLVTFPGTRMASGASIQTFVDLNRELIQRHHVRRAA